ncbi:hypothetical protein [Arthrobacter burdickii]|uniref:Uncharacterized protein n=1 Tax=Arthrobacter burdickii TaxID=3035920 RepID=A0ABT8K5X4_9MICC|nr:hypothetical protein [Arthrobacter burdickii]MDN4611927.1 hypothetical protein [Arthrobacter burdickii]
MLWGIDTNSWAQLWSGVIGSFIAAIVGGLVALLVVRLTNSHQSKIAAVGRERAAAADLLAATNGILKMYDEGKHKVRELVVEAQAAAFRWAMDTTHKGLAEEIRRWPHHVGFLGLDLVKAHARQDEHEIEDAFDRLSLNVVVLRSMAIEWSGARGKHRDRLVAELLEERLASTTDREERDGG